MLKKKNKQKTLRSPVAILKCRCIIFQEEDGKILKVFFKKTGPKMLEVAKKLKDKSLFLWRNQTPNAVGAIASDVQYHRFRCFLAQRKAKQLKNPVHKS